MTARYLTVAIAAFALTGCQEIEPEAVGLARGGLEASVERALDEESAAEPVSMSLELPGADADLDDRSRRDLIVALVRDLAEDEPCGIRGVVAGRYLPDGDGGIFAGRAYRRAEVLVAEGAGEYTPDASGGGGTFVGAYESTDAADAGQVEGAYHPAGELDPRFGTYEGQWKADDDSGDGYTAGLWHPFVDGEGGLFVGYYSRCDLAADHLEG